ncbi:hypothetical protein C444_17118 [Haloarcula japonica DSM 6131]|uniref:Uncharacterized protein n=1 Tax=Haloarcula japonica (strain ATCC 49778 / DSM 6131 / JCM 7785 / NBRC 101032 / NCIMB 13157 / TR-1) TaxID=1227453 RepID=M0L6E5_HALJT|nr:hypothetical protein C444_17118 [Haloarcula japonica DSM 6131]
MLFIGRGAGIHHPLWDTDDDDVWRDIIPVKEIDSVLYNIEEIVHSFTDGVLLLHSFNVVIPNRKSPASLSMYRNFQPRVFPDTRVGDLLRLVLISGMNPDFHIPKQGL